MQRIYLVVALILGLVLGMAAMWWYTQPSATDSPATTVAMSAEEKPVLYWYDPMVPNQHFDQPGKSPFMDMQLVPKYAGATGDAGSVSIDPRLVQNLGARTAKATSGVLAASVRATGSVAFDEGAVSVVQARVAGIVEQLSVRTLLATVTQGQALLTLIAPEWTAAQAEYLALRTSRGSGLEGLRAAARQRLGLLGMSESQIRSVESSGRPQTRITLSAPRAGVVTELMVREGASVMAGTPLLRINGLDTVWINASIPEAQLGRVHEGAQVRIELPAFPGSTFDGKVGALLPDLDLTTRTQSARIVVANDERRLVPGMFARVQINAATDAAETVLVPSEAVIATGTRNVVIVDTGSGSFRAQEVRIGDEASGQTAILEGLAVGDPVVLSGQFLIDSEASLIGTLARLDATEAARDDAPAQREQFQAQGVIENIVGRTWSIATDAIPALEMGAMSMDFTHPEHLPEGVFKAGARVDFSFFRNDAGEFEISKVEVATEGDSR